MFHLWKMKLCLHSTWEGGDSTQLTAKQIIIEISGTVYHRLTAQCLVTGETDLISKELSTTSLRMDSSSSFSSSYKYIQFIAVAYSMVNEGNVAHKLLWLKQAEQQTLISMAKTYW